MFWLAVLLLLAGGGITLQILGPPRPPPARPAVVATTAPSQPQAPRPLATPSPPPPPAAPARPGRDTPGPIADPDPALLEPVTGHASDLLPRIATDGRMPMQVYAAGFDATSRRPRVGLILAGVGLSQADSRAAIQALPGGVTLAFSPYAEKPARLLAAARLAEHEYLLAIPMEPQGYPLSDPGPHALMTNLSLEQNRERLEWALSRFAGYVGATGALGGMRGERFAGMPEQMEPVLSVLARRGLLYIDARPDAAGPLAPWSRNVDLLVDEPATAVEINAKLEQLSRLARENGSALGLAGTVRPVTTDRIARWANGLTADGLALAPVSALVRPPGAAK